MQRAESLLVITRMCGLTSQPRKALTLNEVKRKTAKRRWLYRLAVRWLQFMGRLQQRPAPLTPWAKKIKAFAHYMEYETELSSATIYHRCRRVSDFFERLRIKSGSLHAITPHRIDRAFQKVLEPGGYSRRTIQTCRAHCGLSFVLRKHGAGAVKDWRRPFPLRGSSRRHRYRGPMGRCATVAFPGVGQFVTARDKATPASRLLYWDRSSALGVGQFRTAACKSPLPDSTRPRACFLSADSAPPVFVRGVDLSAAHWATCPANSNSFFLRRPSTCSRPWTYRPASTTARMNNRSRLWLAPTSSAVKSPAATS